MSTDIATAAEFHLTDWWDKNKQRVVQIAAVVAVVALGISFYSWKKSQREVEAGEALSNVPTTAAASQAYLKVAEQYSGTAAAARAILLAAGQAFTDGKYGDAQGLFERSLRESADATWRPQALLGVAACLAASGKNPEAIQKYQDFLKRFATDPGSLAARSALAHLYESQNQPAQALELYKEITQTAQNSSYGLEAAVKLQNLAALHPELLQQPKAAMPAAPGATATPPATAGK